MPFAFNQIQPTTIGTVDKWDIPLNRWLGVKFGAGYDDGLGNAVSNFTEDQIYDEGPILQPKFATKTFGIEGHLRFDEPVSIGKAALLRRRKEAELEKLAYLDSASHSWFSAKAFAGFGAQMAGGFSHPLDLGTAFIPFVGSSVKAAELARFGAGPMAGVLKRGFGGLVEAGLVSEAEMETALAALRTNPTFFEKLTARGILTTEEAIAARGIPFPRLSSAILEGVLSQAAVEIPIAIEKYRSQADYDIGDAATSILGGGAFAGGLHLSGKALKAAWKKVAEVHARLTPETKDGMLKEHEAAHMENRQPDTNKILSVDENAIRERLKFDEAAARADAEKSVESDPALSQREKDRIENQAHDTEVGRLERLGADPMYIREHQRLEAFKQEISDLELIASDKNNPDRKSAATRINELEQDVDVIQKNISKMEQPDPVPQVVAKERNQRITDIINAKKAEHEAAMEGRVSAEIAAERARQIADGRILPEEEVKKYASKDVPEQSDIDAVLQDAKNIEKDAIDRAPTPEEQAVLKKELAELQEEHGYKDDSKSILAAAPCIK